MTRNKRLYINSTFVFSLANFFALLIFFIPHSTVGLDIKTIEYARIFLTRFIEFAIPPVAAVLLYLGGSSDGWKKALLRGALLSSTKAIFILPFYFIQYTDMGKGVFESMGLSLLITLLGIALTFGLIILLYTVLRIAARLVIKKNLVDDLPTGYEANMTNNMRELLDRQAEESLRNLPDKPGVFDFSAPVTVGIFSAVFGEFVINLLFEIINTVDYLIAFAGYYRVGEILYITLSFLFILLELILVHVICYYAKFKICKKRMKDELAEKENN